MKSEKKLLTSESDGSLIMIAHSHPTNYLGAIKDAMQNIDPNPKEEA